MDRLTDLVDPDKDVIQELGVLGLEIDDRVSSLLPDLRMASGVVVVAHAEGWRGTEAALLTGDVIHAVNNAPVLNLAGLRAPLGSIDNRRNVGLQVERIGRLMFITYDINCLH